MVGDTIPFCCSTGVARLVGELIEEVAKRLKVKSERLKTSEWATTTRWYIANCFFQNDVSGFTPPGPGAGKPKAII